MTKDELKALAELEKTALELETELREMWNSRRAGYVSMERRDRLHALSIKILNGIDSARIAEGNTARQEDFNRRQRAIDAYERKKYGAVYKGGKWRV